MTVAFGRASSTFANGFLTERLHRLRHSDGWGGERVCNARTQRHRQRNCQDDFLFTSSRMKLPKAFSPLQMQIWPILWFSSRPLDCGRVSHRRLYSRSHVFSPKSVQCNARTHRRGCIIALCIRQVMISSRGRAACASMR